MEYDRRSGETRLPGSMTRRDDTPTDVMPIPDGLPPGEAQEIVVELHDLATVHKSPFDALPLQTFAKGVVIRSESESRGPIYYEILSGSAHMRSVDEQGRPKDNPRDLKEGDFIGLTGGARVVARTDVRVRVYDMRTLHSAGSKDLLIAVQGKLFGASASESMLKDFENARLREENARQRELINQQAAVIHGRLDELKEQVIRPLRRQLAEKTAEILSLHEQTGRLTAGLAEGDARIAELTAWLAVAFEEVPKLLKACDDRIAKLIAEREAETITVAATLKRTGEALDRQAQEIGLIFKDRNELIAHFDEAAKAWLESEHPAYVQVALWLQGVLHERQSKISEIPENFI